MKNNCELIKQNHYSKIFPKLIGKGFTLIICLLVLSFIIVEGLIIKNAHSDENIDVCKKNHSR